MQRLEPWHGHCRLQFTANDSGRTRHQGGCQAPFKLLRAEAGDDGRCELPLLHTAGGLVGGDQLSIDLSLEPESRSLITSVAAQKVYGSVGRSRLNPDGAWARQVVTCSMDDNSDLEWLPQEMVLYADALLHQSLKVCLPENASFLSAEIVRLGRTAAGEQLKQGCWRSSLEIQRHGADAPRWELVDRLELGGSSLTDCHGLAGAPVFGSLVWAAPMPLGSEAIGMLLKAARDDRRGLSGTMRCSALDQGLVARYIGPSSRDARFWFSRIWARTRALRGLARPRIPRVWPLQEQPLQEQPLQEQPLQSSMFRKNTAEAIAETH
jgi:urease accessory protein